MEAWIVMCDEIHPDHFQYMVLAETPDKAVDVIWDKAVDNFIALDTQRGLIEFQVYSIPMPAHMDVDWEMSTSDVEKVYKLW